VNAADLEEWWSVCRVGDLSTWRQAVWILPERTTAFVRADPAALISHLGRVGDRDTFLGAALHDADVAERIAASGPRRRGTSADAGAITALWADLDWHTAGTTTTHRVLPDRDAADDAINHLAKAGMEPSAVVSTGGGYHLWWALEAPTPASSGVELAWRVQNVTRHICAGIGVDHTADAARVMRCPGTINHKAAYGDAGAPVSLDAVTDARWSLDALDALLGTLERRWKLHRPGARAAADTVDGLTLPGDADRGERVLDMLVEAGVADWQLEHLWCHGWTAARWMRDPSPSGATMGVMSRTWRALAPDNGSDEQRRVAAQAALDVGAAWRRRWAPDAKMTRPDWWRRTLDRVTTTDDHAGTTGTGMKG
jgi:hypothetical protein